MSRGKIIDGTHPSTDKAAIYIRDNSAGPEIEPNEKPLIVPKVVALHLYERLTTKRKDKKIVMVEWNE